MKTITNSPAVLGRIVRVRSGNTLEERQLSNKVRTTTLSQMSNENFRMWLLRWTINWMVFAAIVGSLSTVLKILVLQDA